MDDKLLGDVGDGRAGTDRGSYGSRDHQPGSLVEGRAAAAGKDAGDDGGWTWTKRLRLQRHASFGTVDEDRAATKGTGSGGQDYFGVRSYLHQFYESGRGSSSAARYGKYKCDWRSSKHPHGQCSGIYWWKTMAMFGAGCLVIGIVTIIAGLLIPPRPVAVDSELISDGQRPGDDDAAAAFDFRLEICRMVGLTMFCAGGLILAVSLMVPSFYRSCSAAAGAGDEVSAQPVIADVEEDSDSDADHARSLPVKSAVPVTAAPTEVQPATKLGEATLVSDTLIPYND